MKAESQLLLETKLMLSQSVGDWIKENKLKQEEAAEILGVSRLRISDVVN
ncbi:hypothetical protein [Kingella negevensis]|nr:hypothetical protein [Kingella negevensis]MDK4689717.1 hypothetical protein [Kingella negevensis]WII90240.1 hypothetical protein QEO93_07090 [Kingella negevensis]WII94016.1 hypothetical protein QEO94_04280 [Kingella negevensis]